jgi:antitoxin component of MazEF toxin-antitoxin module
MSIKRVVKWGNSLALRIPAAIAKQMKVAAGEKMAVRLEGTKLVVEVAEELPKFTQADLARAVKGLKVRPDPLGRARGREIL